MTPKDLKDSILLMAVSGDLLPQNPQDEAADMLIKPIREEQQRLLDAKIIKREKFDPTIDYTDPLPVGWCYVKLGELTSLVTKQTGFDYSQTIKPNLIEIQQDGTIPMIQTKNFKGKSFNLKTDYYIPISVAEQFPKILLNSKSMLLSIVGASIGNVGIYDNPTLAIIGGAICKVNLIDDRLYDYLYYYLQSPLGQQEIKKNYKATAQGTITVQNVREIVIKMPPLDEQKRIIAKLEEIFPLIDRYEAAWNKLEAFNKRFPGDMQKSILQLAIQGKLVEQRSEEGTGEELFQKIQAEKQAQIKAGKIKKEKPLPEITEDEIPFDIPDSWKWARLGNIIHIESGKGLTAAQMVKGNIPVYGGNGITGYHNEALLHEETIVIGRVGFYCGSVHVTEKESWVTDNAFITTYPTNSIDRAFLVYMLRHMNLGQNNNATAQPVVSGKKIYPLLFPIPPLAEQRRIAAKLKEILPLCDRLK